MSVFGGLVGGGGGSENPNTVCKGTEKKWSRVALSVCFTQIMPAKGSY